MREQTKKTVATERSFGLRVKRIFTLGPDLFLNPEFIEGPKWKGKFSGCTLTSSAAGAWKPKPMGR
jgi:hypothetical protein